MGPQVVLLGIDMRSERTKARIMPQASACRRRRMSGVCASQCMEQPRCLPRMAVLPRGGPAASWRCVLAFDVRNNWRLPDVRNKWLLQSAYDLLDEAVAALPPGPQHLVVLSGVPLIFPAVRAQRLGCARCLGCALLWSPCNSACWRRNARWHLLLLGGFGTHSCGTCLPPNAGLQVPAAEGILGTIARMARSMPRFRKIVRRTGLMDRFDQPEILDDLLDGWVATAHKGRGRGGGCWWWWQGVAALHALCALSGARWACWPRRARAPPGPPPPTHLPPAAPPATLQIRPSRPRNHPPAEERLQFIRLLQRFSEERRLRVSILSGDAHVGGVGRLYSRPKIKPLG